MAWHEQDDGKLLANIARLLVALAVLAETASGRCYPVRWLLLGILRPAEACAWDFLIGASPSTEAADMPVSAGNTVAELLCLAASLRGLALVAQRLRKFHLTARFSWNWRALEIATAFVAGAWGIPYLAGPRAVDTS